MSDTPEPSELIVEWQGHAGTEWFADTLRQAEANAIVMLIGAARHSTDPRVTAAVMHYDTIHRTLQTVTEKPKRGDDEDTENHDGA